MQKITFATIEKIVKHFLRSTVTHRAGGFRREHASNTESESDFTVISAVFLRSSDSNYWYGAAAGTMVGEIYPDAGAVLRNATLSIKTRW